MLEVLLDSLIDTLKLAPVIIAVHLLIELLERKFAARLAVNKALFSPAAPLVGAAVGIVPQCGFSVVSANLYSAGKISLGTLLAVFIATSDEAIPVILSDFSAAAKLVPLLLIKFVFAIVVGYIIHFLCKNGFKITSDKKTAVKKTETDDAVDNGNQEKHEDALHCHGCHGHSVTGEKNSFGSFLLHPLLHSFTVLLFIFIVTFIMGIVIFYVGEETLIEFLNGTAAAQPFVAALIGLIPNCAASVVISRLYAMGGITLGSAVAGLSAGAGIGYAVLFKENKNFIENVLIISFMFILCSLFGLGVDAVAAMF